MEKEIVIKLNIEFPEYEELKAAIRECKAKWDRDDFTYSSEVTYNHLIMRFPGGFYRIYAGEDTDFKPTFDEMHGGYLFTDKKFALSKKGYQELVEYATEEIRRLGG